MWKLLQHVLLGTLALVTADLSEKWTTVPFLIGKRIESQFLFCQRRRLLTSVTRHTLSRIRWSNYKRSLDFQSASSSLCLITV